MNEKRRHPRDHEYGAPSLLAVWWHDIKTFIQATLQCREKNLFPLRKYMLRLSLTCVNRSCQLKYICEQPDIYLSSIITIITINFFFSPSSLACSRGCPHADAHSLLPGSIYFPAAAQHINCLMLDLDMLLTPHFFLCLIPHYSLSLLLQYV
jgi:hypothetical protein